MVKITLSLEEYYTFKQLANENKESFVMEYHKKQKVVVVVVSEIFARAYGYEGEEITIL